MKKAQINSVILSTLLIFSTIIGLATKITAPPPAPEVNSFIADIFPNNNITNIQLQNISALITIDATDFYNGIKLTFNGNYTVFNPNNLTKLTIYLPFSLCLDFENTAFKVSVNDTQVPFQIETTTIENLTSSGFEIAFIEHLFWLPCPVKLIVFNLTLLENCTYVANYQFDGWIYNPLRDGDVLSMSYSSGSAKYWKGNAKEKVEYKIFGRIPVFGTKGGFYGTDQIIDIDGGKRFICEWDNAQIDPLAISIRYDDRKWEPFDVSPAVFILNIIFYGVLSGVVVILIKRRKRSRLQEEQGRT